MSDARWQRVWDILHEALDLDADRRTALLEQRCVTDAELQREVAGLLSAHEAAENPLKTAPWLPDPDIAIGSLPQHQKQLKCRVCKGLVTLF